MRKSKRVRIGSARRSIHHPIHPIFSPQETEETKSIQFSYPKSSQTTSKTNNLHHKITSSSSYMINFIQFQHFPYKQI
ncbi:hypothetical protein QVD17_18302 [Tagetes erecta]|uniref:Uncharacterized protein n=1 Tax=Tagetes erecta TaxID=13708 RepID=A0AAD8KHV0_TARER|nr:hypothetical protein QVD17_18302 [Tagetes erecta]